MVRPFSKLPLLFDTLDEFQETVFQFERRIIESFNVLSGNLFSLSAGLKTGDGFSQGTQDNIIQKLQVLMYGPSAISLGNIAMHRIARSNLLTGHSLPFIGRFSKDLPGLPIVFDGIIPNP
jgi:hypothetical protein